MSDLEQKIYDILKEPWEESDGGSEEIEADTAAVWEKHRDFYDSVNQKKAKQIAELFETLKS
jgi:hypothetical protein